MPGSADDQPQQARLVIIMPAHDRHDLTGRTAASVLAQLRPTDDFVIVDDGSTPPLESHGAFKDLGPHVRIVRHDTNRGVLAARNTLLRELPDHSHWVLFLDSDDRMLPGWRDLVDREIAAPDQAVLLWFDRLTEEAGRVDGTVASPGQVLDFDALCSGQLRGNFIAVVRRSALTGFLFDERAWGWEGAMWAHVLTDAAGRHVPLPIAIGPTNGARPDSASASSANHAPDRARGMALGAEEYIAALSPRLPTAFPDHYRDLVLTALTWRVIAGDASVRAVIRSRNGLKGATPAQRTRWLKILAAASLPGDVRLAVLDRRSRRRTPSLPPHASSPLG